MLFRFAVVLVGLVLASFSVRAAPRQPWLNKALDAQARAELAVAAMTNDEKYSLILGYFAAPQPQRGYVPPAGARLGAAGYVSGVARLGIPPQWQTDAGIGVATQAHAGLVRQRTALPSGLATAASWDPDVAYRGGAMIGAEARASGFNVMLAGGVNLARDPRNGRNFEYAGEDPLLAGIMVGAEIRGIQSNHIIATVKHFALNDQETGRTILSAEIDESAARQSDFLAFEIAIEKGDPGAVMCAYNRVNAVYACQNPFLLQKILKQDWHFPYYVMSDWGAVHGVEAAEAGLDQESAATIFDDRPYFAADLRDAVAHGRVKPARVDDMVQRILRAMFAKGVVDYPVAEQPVPLAEDAVISRQDAEQGMVLLKNAGGVLPLGRGVRRILLVGSHADVGVLSGGGSSQVYPPGGVAVPGLGPADFPGPMVYFPSSPMKALAAALPGAVVQFDDGADAGRAAKLAAQSDVVLVFAHQWAAEAQDARITLPEGQDGLISAVAAANAHCVVVLETGGPVLMPWLAQVAGVLEAWYPGSAGGAAIANVLTGKVDAAGRLPLSFPKAEAHLPRARLDTGAQPFAVRYQEGAAVGYKWFDKQGVAPEFPFGFGLSYGEFKYSGLRVARDGLVLRASFDVQNVGGRAAAAVPQIYAQPVAGIWEAPKRLGGWQKLLLAPGEKRHVEIVIEPRLLAVWDMARHGWRVARGAYDVVLGSSARDVLATARVRLRGGRI